MIEVFLLFLNICVHSSLPQPEWPNAARIYKAVSRAVDYLGAQKSNVPVDALGGLRFTEGQSWGSIDEDLKYVQYSVYLDLQLIFFQFIVSQTLN